jgi:hypothetical protein
MNLKKLLMIVGGLIVAILIAVIYAVLLWGVYVSHWDTPFTRVMAKTVYIPVARVGKTSISLSRFYEDVDSLKTYLASESAKASGGNREITNDDRSQALERLIEEAAIEEMAMQKEVTLEDAEIDKAIDEQFVSVSSTRQDLEKEINDSYGWSLQDFKDHIVRPILLERKLAVLANSSDSQQGLSDVINVLAERVQKEDVVRYLKF